MTQPDIEPTLPGTAPAAGSVASGGRAKYQILPHARVGGVTGLLELLADRGGKEDLYRLASDLVMDVEDLLPIVEAGDLLGFVTLKEGDAEITPTGRAFATADIQARKRIFREAALEHVTILRQIECVLRQKLDHSIPEEFFHDIVDEHFSEDEVRRQLETAMNWGRYAEIFDYDRESGRLVQPEVGPAA
jgi:NitT/TauT family transport system ATP-binding protein